MPVRSSPRACTGGGRPGSIRPALSLGRPHQRTGDHRAWRVSTPCIFIDSVLYSFLLTETLATFIGISVLGGILWRRANRWGAFASILGAMTTNFLLYFVTGQRLDYWDPNVFLAALTVGVIGLVVVSLATAPEPAASLESSSRGSTPRATVTPRHVARCFS